MYLLNGKLLQTVSLVKLTNFVDNIRGEKPNDGLVKFG